MENLYDPASTVLSRTTYIFNKTDFSDVVLVVGEQQIQYQGHKLLLSLASPVFARNFEEIVTTDKIITFPVPDADPAIFYKVLKYIYTDEVELNSVREAHNVLRSAEKFQILALQQTCKDYIKLHGILPENAIKIFETAGAATLQMSEVQELCLHTFSEQTTAVFKSDAFLGALQSTIEAIVQRDALAIDSEMDILNAVLKWGEVHCKSNDLPIDANLRVVVDPLLKQIRFLTISLSDLQAFWKAYNNLMTSEEVFAITISLVQPGLGVEMPKTICPIKNPRNASNCCKEENSKTPDSHSNAKDNITLPNSAVLEETTVKQLNTCSLPEVAQHVESKRNIVEEDKHMYSLSNTTKSISSTVTKSVNCFEYNSVAGKLISEGKTSVSNQEISMEKYCVERQFSSPITNSPNLTSLPRMNNFLSKSFNDSTAAVIQGLCCKTEIIKGMKTRVSPQKKESDSESEDENASETSESDSEETITNCKSIKIELDESKEIPRGMRPADITSNITINVIKGLIRLLGVEIQMRNIAIKAKNSLEFMITVENEDNNYEKICNNDTSSRFYIFFDEPLHILANKKAKIIVSVEGVQLRHCCLYTLESSFHCSDERGNHFEIQVNGNQDVEGIGLPFLISNVLYSHH